MASILPKAKTQFTTITGRPLAGGRVYFYEPNTETKKDTWQDEAMTIPNTNPVVLDARGEAVIWGSGTYRQVVIDVLGLTIWDQLTADVTAGISDQIDAVFSELADTTDADKGDALIGVRASFPGAVARNQHDKNAETISAADFGAVGDGVTDDTAKFTAFEAGTTGQPVNLLGKTYVVTAIPPGNKYFNGSFTISGTTYSAPFSSPVRFGNNLLIAGDGGGAALPNNYDVGVNPFTYTNGLTLLGPRAGANLTDAHQTIAIGPSAMENTVLSFDNTAIGEVALQNVQSTSASYGSVLTGTRNVAIGGNAGQFTRVGNQNTFIGRNAGTSAVGTVGATAVGAGALFGWQATGGWDASIQNWWPSTSTTANTLAAFGAYSANRYTGLNVTALGPGAATNLARATYCTVVGLSAALYLESTLLPNGNTQVIPSGGTYNATYSVTAGVVTVTYPGHSAVAGQRVGFRISNGPIPTNGGHVIYETVQSVIDANTFTISTPLTGTGTGTFIVYTFDQGVAGTPCSQNTVVGAQALHGATMATTANTVIGFNAASIMDSSINNVVVGGSTGTLSTKMTSTTLLGTNAASYGGNGSATLTQCTFVGAANGYQYINGTVPASYTNVSILGFNALVSGDNQVQLGNSLTTVYVYGTVQNRSDLRDKADVRDTVLGLDFINALRPVDYKWNMREDYIVQEATGTVDENGSEIFKTVTLPNDGSKTRMRYHHGLIAQEVQELEAKGFCFGGFQDHSIKDGADVMTIGYDELIAPLIKAVQQLSAEVAALKAAQNGSAAS